MIIEDGTGTGKKAMVDGNNRVHTSAVTRTESHESIDRGDAYNLNTGVVNLTGSADSALLYLKNNETNSFVVSSIVVGLGSHDGVSDSAVVTVVRNPTTGDIVTDVVNVDMNQNRNFGSSKTLTADAYKGKITGSMTDGDDIILFYQTAPGRLFGSIDLELTKGDSIGIKVNPNLLSGSVNVYAAIIGYVEDEENK